jgi:hypothetical protein
VPLALQVKNHFSRAGRVSRTFAVDSIQNVGHRWLEV